MPLLARVYDSSANVQKRLATVVPDSGTLATTAVATLSSLTSIATIGTGVWEGTDVGVAHGGTGASTAAAAATALGVGAASDVTHGSLIIGTDGATAGDVKVDNTNGGEIIWEGSTADGNENKLRAADGAGVNTLPASTGTILTTATAVTVAQGGTGATTAAAAAAAFLNIDMDGDFTIGNQSGDVCTIGGALTVTGNLIVSGTTTTVNTATLSVEDPLIILASGNDADSVDVGFYAKYVDSGTKYAGLFRDASDSDKWKLFATTGNTNEAPTTTVNTGSGFTYGTLVVDTLVGAVTGNASTATLAATATVLASSRNIGGVAFNGGANIDLPGVNSAGNQSTSGLAATATKIASITNSNIVQLTAAQTLTSKTLTAAKIANGGFLADANDNELLQFANVGSAVNHLVIQNVATGSSPVLSSTGSDTDVGMTLSVKAAGAMWALLGNNTTSAFAIKDSSGETQLSVTAGGAISGTVIDNGSSLGTSSTLLATQGAIKTYVDAQVTAQDLDVVTDSGNIDIDLDSDTLSILGGTGITSGGSSTTVTLVTDASQGHVVALGTVASGTWASAITGAGFAGANTMANTAQFLRTLTEGSLPDYTNAWTQTSNTATSVANYDVVHLTGTGSGDFDVVRANASLLASSTNEVTIAVASNVYATPGDIVKVALLDPGDDVDRGVPLYLSATVGKVSVSAPATTNYRRIIGYVAEGIADPGTNSTIMMRFWPQVEGELI